MEDEFNKELSSHINELKANALRLCKNDADAQDLLQDTMQKALRYRDKFEMGTNMRAWLYTIMRNHFINTYRSKKRFYEIVESNKYLLAQENTKSTADEDVAGKSELEYLVNSLRDIVSEDFFETLILVDYHSKSYKEAAKILGVPVGTIMSRLNRGRKQSQEYLLEHYDRGMLLEAVTRDAVEKVSSKLQIDAA